MAKRTTRKQVGQFLILLVAVALVVSASVLFQRWWNNRPDPEPQDVAISAKVTGDKAKKSDKSDSVAKTTVDVHPYIICELDNEQCPEGTVDDIALDPEQTLTLNMPKSIYDHDWQILKIYDDPEANAREYFKPFEQKRVEIPAKQGDAELVIVEVRTLMIGHDKDNNNEETPYEVVWALHVAGK